MGVQFKKSGALIGYLQFETGSVQMNNQNSNMFSENTFTFNHGTNGITNEKMEAIYHQVCNLIEAIKYRSVAPAAPAAPAPQLQSNICPKCGSSVGPADMFCMSCGQKLH